MTAVILGTAILAGALTQRITGIGFALVASPFLVLALGPVQGVVVTNIFGTMTSLVVFLLHRREVEYRRIAPILLAAVIGVIPGALLARTMPAPVLAIGAGLLVLAALALSVFARRIPRIDGVVGRASAGLLGGFMNVVAGVGGPAVTAYAIATKWDHLKFAVSVQFYFVFVGIASLLLRAEPPTIAPVEWLVASTALAIGIVGGQLATRVVSVNAARIACLVIACLGSVLTVVSGVRGLAG